ncbi:MAG: DoxX family protein [Alphaproteobacteria bacterium]|nr:MAG: DoxX family protein [Alphaproteobacteria bacterium]
MTSPPGKPILYLAWSLQLMAAAIFLMAGWKKLTGDAQMAEVFATIGLGQWFRYLTGGLEVVGAIALLWPRRIALGGAVLTVVMVGAVIAHLTVLGGSPLLAIVLLVACLMITAMRRDTLPAR